MTIKEKIKTSRAQRIILQPTPFCNMNCRYCYLPYRSVTKQMSHEVMARIFSEVLQSKHLGDPIEFTWHAGEPLTVSQDFYRAAFDLSIGMYQLYQRRCVHSIQTNATLINDEWIDLFHEYDIRIGVSLDGPAFVHDQQRVTRSGQGTHEKVMRGVRLLQEGNIQFSVIMVLTRFSLDYPDEIFHFFLEHGIREVGINVDEIEGTHKSSSYEAIDAIEKYRNFMRRFVRLVDESRGALRIREFSNIVRKLLSLNNRTENVTNITNVPLGLLTFDYLGNYSTFCPELAGAKSEKYHDFVMGNVFTDPINCIFENPVFQLVNEEVQAGVQACKNSCFFWGFWGFCGGGAPANKFFEHGRFDVTTTLACRIHKGVLVDVIMEYLEDKFSLPNGVAHSTGAHRQPLPS
jgi:uncharacterized protein